MHVFISGQVEVHHNTSIPVSARLASLEKPDLPSYLSILELLDGFIEFAHAYHRWLETKLAFVDFSL